MHTYRLTPTRWSSRRYGQSALNLRRLLADAHLPFVAILVVDLINTFAWFARKGNTTCMLWRLLPIISVGCHFLNLFQTKYHSNRWSNRQSSTFYKEHLRRFRRFIFKKIIGQQSVNHCANRQKHKYLCADKNRNYVLWFWVTCRSKRSSRQIANHFTHFPKCLLRFLFSQHLVPSFHIVEHEIVGLPL